MLVLQRVGELVDEGDLEADGHLGAAHPDALVGGVVERERAAVDHAVERLVEVELARRHAEGAELPGVVLEVGSLAVLRRPLVVLGGRRGVLGGGEEVDVHRVVEVEVALVLDEGGEVGDPGIPLVGVARARRRAIGSPRRRARRGAPRDRHAEREPASAAAALLPASAGATATGRRSPVPGRAIGSVQGAAWPTEAAAEAGGAELTGSR